MAVLKAKAVVAAKAFPMQKAPKPQELAGHLVSGDRLENQKVR
jgi:hypothetical protein